jgi:hypothetical protein
MKSVIRDVYAETGLKFEWRNLNSFRTGETFPEVVVIKFRNECALRGCLLGWREPAITRELKPLGYAATSDGRVLPFATVFCDRVLETITPAAVTLDLEERAKLVGRALGRVVAHELYHMLTRTTHHARKGILKPYHTRMDLVGDELEFEADQLELLRQHATEHEATEAAGGSY